MRLPPLSPDSASSPLLWYAVLGAPAGWTLQFSVGYWLAESACSRSGGELFGVGLGTWMVPLTALALAAALGGGVTALSLYRRTASADTYDAPPPGRIRFLATIGLAVTALFIALIALTALGVFVHYPPCSQS